MRVRRDAQWTRLDNAAKIFPSTSTREDAKVFRFSCELMEPVKQPVLQRALEKTLDAFPLYRSVLKRGLFWYYLEASELPAVAKPEEKPPVSPIYLRDRRTLLFEVTYYQNRINLEVFHALTDGTGALQFLRTLVYHYLAMEHPEAFAEGKMTLDYDASETQKNDDSFQRYYSSEKKKKREKQKNHTKFAYRIRGQKVPENRTSVIEGVMSVQEVMAKAHEYGATMTVLLASVMMRAIYEEMPERKKKRPVVITIPVNLRKFFSSVSARNFFSIVNIGYDFRNNPPELEEIIPYVAKRFREELTEERLAARMNSLASIERNFLTRIVPLVVKDEGLKIAYDYTAAEATASLSNVGRITMPDKLAQYIRLFDVFVSTDKLQICMCSFHDTLTVSFTSNFLSTDIQRRFFRTLTGMGIEVEIVANRINDD